MRKSKYVNLFSYTFLCRGKLFFCTIEISNTRFVRNGREFTVMPKRLEFATLTRICEVYTINDRKQQVTQTIYTQLLYR